MAAVETTRQEQSCQARTPVAGPCGVSAWGGRHSFCQAALGSKDR